MWQRYPSTFVNLLMTNYEFIMAVLCLSQPPDIAMIHILAGQKCVLLKETADPCEVDELK